jgi:hypothetical protein
VNRKSSRLVTGLLLVCIAYLLHYLGWLPAPLQILLGIVVVGVLPGYLFTEIFAPNIGSTHRLTLSLGLSAVFIILAGFFLHLTGFGLVKEMWLALSFYSVVILGILALVRASQHHAEPRPVLTPKLHEPLLVLVAVGIAVAALSIAVGSSQRQRTPITQLWLLPSETGSVQVGVVSNDIETFRLEVTGDGQELFDDLVVTPDARATVIPLELSQNYGRLEATLYIPGSDVPYRRVVLW